MSAGSDASIIAYAARALGDFRQRSRRNGRAMPIDLEALYALLSATDRQVPPTFADDASATDALVMTYEQAAKRLAVSERTLQRLVSSGQLPRVEVGGCKRITTADLHAYVEGLGRERSA